MPDSSRLYLGFQFFCLEIENLALQWGWIVMIKFFEFFYRNGSQQETLIFIQLFIFTFMFFSK